MEGVMSFNKHRRFEEITRGYDAKYLKHLGGVSNNEFTIRDATQIKRYVVVLYEDAVKKYRS